MRRHFFRHIGCPAAQATHVLCGQATGYTVNTTICRSSTDSAITHRLTRFCQQIIKMSCKIELLAGHLSGKYSVLASLVFVLWSTEFPVRIEKYLTCFTSSLDNYPICIVKFGGDYIYRLYNATQLCLAPNWQYYSNIQVCMHIQEILSPISPNFYNLPSPQIFRPNLPYPSWFWAHSPISPNPCHPPPTVWQQKWLHVHTMHALSFI